MSSRLLVVIIVFFSLAPPVFGQEEQYCFGQTPTRVGTEGDDEIFAGSFSEVIDGLGGNDTIHLGGGQGSHLACGGTGNDHIIGDGGDEANGGPGDDILERIDYVTYKGAPAAVEVDLEAGTATGGHGNDTISGAIGVQGSQYADVLLGNDADNFFDPGSDEMGRQAGDVIDGRGGNDTLSSFGESASLSGGSGDDRICGLMLGGTTIDGGPGDDFIGVAYASPDNQPSELDGGPGSDWFDVLAARCDFSSGPWRIDLEENTASWRDGPALPVTGIENVRTGRATDILIGDEGPNVLIGGGKADVLRGGGGDDELRGMRGPDVLTGGADNDELYGGHGDDDLEGGPGSDDLHGDLGSDRCQESEGPTAGCE